MADNLIGQQGTGTTTLAFDDVGGVYWARGKMAFGTDGTAVDVSSVNPLPVTAIGTVGISGTLPVSGTIGVSGTVPVSGTMALSGTSPVSGTIGVSGTVPILGTVGVSGTVPVSGTMALSGTSPVSGTVGISGTANVFGVGGTMVATPSGTQAVSGTLSVAGTVPISGTMALSGTSPVVIHGGTSTLVPSGTQAVTLSGTGLVQAVAGSSTIGDVGLALHTAGGLTPHVAVSTAGANPTSVKAAPGRVYSIQAFNLNAFARFLKIYNKASAPTVGSDPVVKNLLIPGNTSGAGLVLSWPQGFALATGIAYALTTGGSSGDTGAVALGEVIVNVDYA